MPIQISLKKSTANPTSSSGLTLGEPVFNYGNNTLWMGLGGTTTPAWIGAGVCGASGGIAAGITYQIPTLGAVKDYFSGISGSFAILGRNTFTGLNSFNAGVSSAGGTFSALTRFPSGISASTLRVSSGATFNGDVSIGSDNINYSGSNELFVNAPNKGIWIGDGNGASNGTYLYVSDNAQQVVLNAPNYFSVTAPTAFASPDQDAHVSVLVYTQPTAIQDVMQITDPLDNSANGTKLRILPNGNLFIRGLVESIGGVSASGGITFNGIVNGVTASFSRLVSFTQGISASGGITFNGVINGVTASFSRLVSFTQGISSAGGTFSALTSFTAGLSASGTTAAFFNGTVDANSSTVYRPTLRYYNEPTSSPAISSNTLTLDLSAAQVFTVSLNSAVNTLSITNTPSTANRSIGFTLIFTADGTPRSVTWGSAIKWAAGASPSLTSTNGKKDVFTFLSTDAGTSWLAFVGGQNF